MQILGMHFDAVVVEVKNTLLLFRYILSILFHVLGNLKSKYYDPDNNNQRLGDLCYLKINMLVARLLNSISWKKTIVTVTVPFIFFFTDKKLVEKWLFIVNFV